MLEDSGVTSPTDNTARWEHILMNFITGLSRSIKGDIATYMNVDRLTKSVHFILFRVDS